VYKTLGGVNFIFNFGFTPTPIGLENAPPSTILLVSRAYYAPITPAKALVCTINSAAISYKPFHSHPCFRATVL
jgi:hypothetical protein